MPAEHLRDFFVVGGKAVFGVHQKNHGKALVKGRFDLAANLALKYVVGSLDPSARVDEAKHTASPLCTAVVAVSGYARDGVDDGFALLNQAIKKSGLAHVGAAYDGN